MQFAPVQGGGGGGGGGGWAVLCVGLCKGRHSPDSERPCKSKVQVGRLSLESFVRSLDVA